jgi:hypothetical protein
MMTALEILTILEVVFSVLTILLSMEHVAVFGIATITRSLVLKLVQDISKCGKSTFFVINANH